MDIGTQARRLGWLTAFVATTAQLAACAPTSAEAGATAQDPATIVGGRLERGYLAAGYMAIAADGEALAGPYCGATLIAPNLAVTAAHCIDAAVRDRAATHFGFGVGQVADGRIYTARVVVRHPGFVFEPSLIAYVHDIALLVLDDDVPRTVPARIAAAPDGCAMREVGYGRVTSGDASVADGYTDERKSTVVCLEREDSGVLYVRGRSGGLCYGDSGGAVMVAGADQVVGLLSAFADEAGVCAVGDHMTLTSLDGERDWISTTVQKHALAPPPRDGEPCGDYAAVTTWTCTGAHEKVRCVDGAIEHYACDARCVVVDGADDTCSEFGAGA